MAYGYTVTFSEDGLLGVYSTMRKRGISRGKNTWQTWNITLRLTQSRKRRANSGSGLRAEPMR